jgi:APA family basic amino acid/polyamine antiporter
VRYSDALMTDLLRRLRRWDLVALVLNFIVGAGIFGLPSHVQALAGAYSLLAYVVCAVPIFLIILCYAEVSSRFEETGGQFVYARAAFGRIAGFEVGWLTWLARVTGFAALCNVFVDYLAYFVPLAGSGHARIAVVAIVVLILAIVNAAGVRMAAFITNIFTVGKLVPLLLLVVVGVFFIAPANYSLAAAPAYRPFSASVLLLIFAFTGFEIAVIPAGEAVDPRRDLPFALLSGVGITVLLYLAIHAVCIGLLPDLAQSARPLTDAGARVFGRAGGTIVALGALISVTGTLNGIMLAAPRLLFAMADDGQLPPVVAATHRRFRTPHVAIAITSVSVFVVTVTGTFLSTATLSTIIRLVTYAVTCAALPVLRRTGRSKPALFTVPGGASVAAAALMTIVWLFSSSSWQDAGYVAAAAIAGLVLYAAASA